MTRALSILEAERAKGTLVDAHICVSRAGEAVFGQGQDIIMPWLSSGKPLTAILIGQLVERGLIEWRTPIEKILPEFVGPGKELVTIEHLLTHTAGLRAAERVPDEFPWAHKVAAICACPLEPDWIPGQKAGYHISGTWFLLAEIARRVTGQDFESLARQWIFEPLEMTGSGFTFANNSNLGVMMDTTKNPPEPARELLDVSMLRPGGGARGPIRELARFYESLLGFGPQILKPATIREVTARRREGMYDWTFLHKMDWGLGFIINSNRYGAETVPYGFGRHASESAFGHGGSQSSCAFADPEHGLVVAWVLNGRPGERAHQIRARELNTAIYEDLGL